MFDMANRLDKIVLWFLGALFFILLGVIIVTMNRGFDFEDESFYMLCYKYPYIYRESVSTYHVVIHAMNAWLNPGIIMYRVESLFFTLLSSWVFWKGLKQWLAIYFPEAGAHAPTLFLVVFLGNFVHYFVGLQTLNYNILNNAIIVSSVGMLLSILAEDASLVIRSRKKMLLAALVGVLCWFSFVIKFSAGLLEVIAYGGLFIVYYMGRSFRASLVIVGIMLIGVIVGAGIYFLTIQSYSVWWADFLAGLVESTKPTDHPPDVIIQKYKDDLYRLYRFSVWGFGWIVIFPALLLANYKFGKNKLFVWGRNTIIATGTVWFCYQLYRLDLHRSNFIRNWDYRNGYLYPLLMALLLSLLVVAAIHKRISVVTYIRARYHLILVIVFLACLPLVGTIGTFNPLFLNLLFNAAPWFVVIWLLAVLVSRNVGQAVAAICVIVTFGFTASQIVDGNTYNPYFSAFRNHKTNIFQQTATADAFPQLRGIYLDTATVHFLNEMKTQMDRRPIHPRYPMWTYSAGLTYLLGGIQTEVFWFNRTCKAVGYFLPHNEPPIFVVADSRKKIRPELDTCFRSRGIRWPEDYEVTGTVWQPHDGAQTTIYYPKNYR